MRYTNPSHECMTRILYSFIFRITINLWFSLLVVGVKLIIGGMENIDKLERIDNQLPIADYLIDNLMKSNSLSGSIGSNSDLLHTSVQNHHAFMLGILFSHQRVTYPDYRDTSTMLVIPPDIGVSINAMQKQRSSKLYTSTSKSSRHQPYPAPSSSSSKPGQSVLKPYMVVKFLPKFDAGFEVTKLPERLRDYIKQAVELKERNGRLLVLAADNDRTISKSFDVTNLAPCSTPGRSFRFSGRKT